MKIVEIVKSFINGSIGENELFQLVSKSNPEITKIYLKYRRYDVLEHLSYRVLLTKFKNGTFLDYIYSDVLKNSDCSDELKLKIRKYIFLNSRIGIDVARICFNNNDYDAILENKDFLLSSNSEGVLYFDLVISSLLTENKFDKLLSVNLNSELLMHRSKFLNNERIVEYIFDNYRKSFSWDSLSSFRLLCAPDGSITLLEVLINKDWDFVNEMIRRSEENNDMRFKDKKIVSILKANGFDNYDLNIQLNDSDQAKVELASKKRCYDEKLAHIGYISIEANQMIEIFRELMLSDGRSDKEIVEFVCTSFRYLFAINNQYAMRDLQSLINIKYQNPDFSMKKCDKSFGADQSSFNTDSMILYMEDSFSVEEFNHELTHILHFFYNWDEIPPEYYKIKNTFSSEVYDKVLNYVKRIYDIYQGYLNDFANDMSMNAEDEEVIKRYYGDYRVSFRLDLKSDLNSSKYSREFVEYLYNNVLTFDEFSVSFQRVYRLENATQKFYSDYSLELIIEDILDAVLNGLYYDNCKYFITGHGKSYYSSHLIFGGKNETFHEIIADYGAIIKSEKSELLIEILVDIFGKDFVDMLQQFYDKLYIDNNGKQFVGGRGRGL